MPTTIAGDFGTGVFWFAILPHSRGAGRFFSRTAGTIVPDIFRGFHEFKGRVISPSHRGKHPLFVIPAEGKIYQRAFGGQSLKFGKGWWCCVESSHSLEKNMYGIETPEKKDETSLVWWNVWLFYSFWFKDWLANQLITSFPGVGRVNGSRLRSLHFRLHEALYVMATKPANGQKIKIQLLGGFNKGRSGPHKKLILSGFEAITICMENGWILRSNRRPKRFRFKVREPLAASFCSLGKQWTWGQVVVSMFFEISPLLGEMIPIDWNYFPGGLKPPTSKASHVLKTHNP